VAVCPADADQDDAPEQPAAAPERTAAADPGPDLKLADVAICTGVSEDREPVDAGQSFPEDVGTLYCFTDVRDAGEPTTIVHRWYVGDDLVSEVPMEVKGPRWRCWSEKEIAPGWSGGCRVEVVNEDGDVIGERAFALGAREPSTRTGG
jgi:hypothetical protein